MQIGSLFSGIGGFDLAARWMGWETKWYSEIDPYGCRVMERHFGEAYNVRDITKWTPTVRDTVDVVCGGFPCQPISLAGKRKAQEDERWLWPEFARVLGVLRPRYVVIENVPGLRSRGMGDVLRDLSKIGYDAEWTSLSAADVGAPHKRERVWIVAYDTKSGRGKGWARRPHSGSEGSTEQTLQDVADPNRAGRLQHGRAIPVQSEQPTVECGGDNVGNTEGVTEWTRLRTAKERREWWGRPRHPSWWAVEPSIRRVAYGVPSRVDRLKCLGNAIVPQCAYVIFKCLQEG